ncbi:MAG: hypothetical protein ACREOM_06710 [Candidatus Dormibacteraceae bacterium]
MTTDAPSTRPLLDKLGVKPGMRIAVVDLDDATFLRQLSGRTSNVFQRKPRAHCDMVFLGATSLQDLARLKGLKPWIEPNGAIWVVRPKGGRSSISDTDAIAAGLAAGLVDNKIASFSDTHAAMRFVYRLRDSPQ